MISQTELFEVVFTIYLIGGLFLVAGAIYWLCKLIHAVTH